MDKNIFKDHAYILQELGLSFLPLNGKVPIVNNWPKYANEPISSMVLQSWEAQFPNKNIGLILGSQSGVVAIDYDAVTENKEVTQAIPNSMIERFGKKGFVRFYKYNGEKSRKFPNIQVELFSSGGQVVLPPSIHPDTKVAYKWISPKNLYDIDSTDCLDPLPSNIIEQLENLEAKYKKEKIHANTLNPQTRNNSLFNLCSALVGKGESSESIKTKLIEFDKMNHSSPWLTDKTEPHKGDVHKAVESMIKRVQALESRNQPQTHLTSDWMPPNYLENKLTKLTELKNQHLPDLAFNFCQDLSNATGGPIEFFAVTLLTTLSSLISRCFKVQPKEKDSSWLVTPNLYGIIIGRPGLKKSPAMKLGGINFLNSVDQKYREIDKKNIARFEASKKILEINIDKVKDRIKSNKHPDGLPEQLQELELQLGKLKPKLHSVLINKITPASLINIAGLTNKTLLLHRDEMSALFCDMKSKEMYELREILLEGWNGDNTYRKQTKTVGNDEVEVLSMACLGAIQPSKISPLIEEIRKGINNDGLFQRFQLIAFPKGEIKSLMDVKLNTNYQKSLSDLYSQLQLLDLRTKKTQLIHFNSDSQKIFIEFCNNLVIRQNSPETSALLLEFLSKVDSLLPSVALAFELISSYEKSGQINDSHSIGTQAIETAINYINFNECHIQKMINFSKTVEMEKAVQLIKKIKEKKFTDGMTVRDVTRAGWHGLNDVSDVKMGLDELEAHHWVRVDKVRTSGRPSEKIFVNPTILEQGVEKFTQEGFLK